MLFRSRNPWRFSFDNITGDLWVGDVGQNNWEEIDIVENGGNYGWNLMEGNHCYSPSINCDPSNLLERPIWEYDHGKGISITGGFVYRGSSIASLYGLYIYADYGLGKIWGLEYDSGIALSNSLLIDAPFSITSFGVDLHQELYMTSFNGNIYKLAVE